MNSVLVDIKDKLVDAGIGTFAGTASWGIFLTRFPDAPVDAICLYDTGGQTPEHVMDADIPSLRRESFTARVRAGTYLTAYQKMTAICAALDRIGSWTVTGSDMSVVRYSDIFQRSEITLFQQDEKDRYILSADFESVRKETSTGG